MIYKCLLNESVYKNNSMSDRAEHVYHSITQKAEAEGFQILRPVTATGKFKPSVRLYRKLCMEK